MKLIFDSNVFDEFISGVLDINFIKEKKWEVYITHIQIDEINNCGNSERRALLFNFMLEIRPFKSPTESFIIGTSRIGSAKLSGNDDIFEKLKAENPKHINDALIGETAIKNDLILITNDLKLKKKVIELGGNSLTVDELINEG